MSLSHYQIKVAGFSRQFVVGPYSDPKAAIICLHGGGGRGAEFIREKWSDQMGKDLIIVGPTALVSPTADKTRWIINDPSEAATWPEGADGTTDYQFIEAIRQWLGRMGVQRVFVSGFSSGGKLTFGLLMSNFQADGFAPVSRGLPKLWAQMSPAKLTPLFFQFGTKDSHDDDSPYSLTYRETFEWNESRWNAADPNVAKRQACKYTLREHSYPTEPALRQHVMQGEGHAWTQCRSYKTSDTIVQFFGL